MDIINILFPISFMRGKEKERGETPCTKELVKTTLKVAWPSIVEQFLVSLVGFIDTAMVSGLGAYAIAAVGLCNQPKFITLVPILSLNVALSSIVARRFGQKKRDDANAVLRFALLFAFIVSTLVVGFSMIFREQILRLAGTQSDTHGPAVEYFSIVVGLSIFNVLSLVINAAQRGVGNTKIAMRTNLTSNAVNVVLNYLLIEGHFGFPRLGLKGAAIATVIGSVVACAMSFSTILRKDGYLYLFHCKEKKIDGFSLRSMWSVGSSSLLEQLFLRIGFMTYAIIVAGLGTVAFAAHQMGLNIITLSFSLGNGLSIAAVALVGKTLGEERPDLAKIYASICQRIGLMFSITLSLFYYIIGERLFMVFTKDPKIIAYAEQLMSLIVFLVIVQISMVIFSGCLRGAGDTKVVALISLISVTFIRPISGYIFVKILNWGLIGAWLGLAFDQAVRFTLNFLRFKSNKWLTMKV